MNHKTAVILALSLILVVGLAATGITPAHAVSNSFTLTSRHVNPGNVVNSTLIGVPNGGQVFFNITVSNGNGTAAFPVTLSASVNGSTVNGPTGTFVSPSVTVPPGSCVAA